MVLCSFVSRHGDVPWLPRLSALGSSGQLFGARGGGGVKGPRCERFETLGVNEGDSSDIKKVIHGLHGWAEAGRSQSSTRGEIGLTCPSEDEAKSREHPCRPETEKRGHKEVCCSTTAGAWRIDPLSNPAPRGNRLRRAICGPPPGDGLIWASFDAAKVFRGLSLAVETSLSRASPPRTQDLARRGTTAGGTQPFLCAPLSLQG